MQRGSDLVGGRPQNVRFAEGLSDALDDDSEFGCRLVAVLEGGFVGETVANVRVDEVQTLHRDFGEDDGGVHGHKGRRQLCESVRGVVPKPHEGPGSNKVLQRG
jgi:hypothetical protein